MFRPKSPQPSTDDLRFLLPTSKQIQLEQGWPGAFRREILPMLLEAESDFADLYASNLGAPNKPVAEMLGISILKEMFDYTDEETREAVTFNMQWHYALQMGLSRAGICQKTLHNFRVLLFASGKHKRLFHQLTGRIIERFAVNTTRQRMDSTHIVGAMKQLTRLGLFVKTIEAFLFKLDRMAQKDAEVALLLDTLPNRFAERYLDRRGYFSDTRSSLARRRLDACAKDLWELIDRFRGHQKVCHLKQYRHLQRLFKDQCELQAPTEDPSSERLAVPKNPELVAAASATVSEKEAPDEEAEKGVCPTHSTPSLPQPIPSSQEMDTPAADPSLAGTSPDPTQESASASTACSVHLKAPSQVASTSLQSPSDPDATYGPKGKGYQLQVVETCHEDNPFEVITTLDVEGAHESDQNATLPLLETLHAHDRLPEDAFADANYISGENIVDAAEMGVNLLGPLPGSKPGPDKPTLADFRFDPSGQYVLQCPADQAPARHQDSRNATGRHAYWDGARCAACPLAATCPTHKNQTERRLTWTLPELATAARQREEETAAFKEAYKIRSGIEATLSEEKNGHGLGDLRVRGHPAIELACTFKTLAVNVKRAVKYVQKTLKKVSSAAQQATKEGLMSCWRRTWAQRTLVYAFLNRFQASWAWSA